MNPDAVVAAVLAAGREFLTLTLTVLPYLLTGAVAGAMLEIPVARRWSARLLSGTGLRPLVTAIAAAALLPGCSCATIPMAAGLKSASAPRLGTVAAFVFMSPLLSPITVALTWAMLGWKMTLARVVAAFAGSLMLGLLVNRLEATLLVGEAWQAGSAAACGCGQDSYSPNPDAIEESGRLRIFWHALLTILRGVTPYFLLGMAIAAGLSTLLPENAIPRVLGGAAGLWAYGAAALVGIPLYVCEGEEIPITYALMGRGLGPGPSLTFLLGSVGTCVPTMLMARQIIGRRATLLYAAFWLVFSIAAGVLFQLVAAHPA